ncbi:hypothetical protein BC792_10197 [Sphingobacterium allocomposti]|jgi:hypothetical protein|uniref:Outer membrane protein with beta-barrel domain n=1 Tax=Sphingobacterium allocomposti TaxID=415956 RepID=A0A5S5DR82_9SPHI|nr:hypothetical protein [Sphingobacterium composti Yoo et al. 2007 non Ten et al. 2007]TYP98443.1 hypothetical protein BC792_10197 [Sphingobacterium composti Yoo et al. 2007 non Ten et al. 2007]HLS96762.1 hypothetical protein [Sphingobacterium sp.]
MKKFRIVTTSFLLSICHLTLYGQTITDTNVHFGMAGNTLHRFQSVDGGGSGEDRLSYLAGVQVGFGLTEKLTLVSGIDYARHNLTVVSAPMPEQRSTDGHITTLSFPLGIKWNIGRWFFIQGGPSLDVQPTKWEAVDNQNGIGLYAAIGGRYALGKWSLSLTPSVKQYALISFGDGSYPQRLLTAGALLAVGYEF